MTDNKKKLSQTKKPTKIQQIQKITHEIKQLKKEIKILQQINNLQMKLSEKDIVFICNDSKIEKNITFQDDFYNNINDLIETKEKDIDTKMKEINILTGGN